MRGQPGAPEAPLTALRVRRVLIAACVIATFPTGWRVGEAAASLERAMLAYRHGIELERVHRLDEASVAFKATILQYPRMLAAYKRLAAVELGRGRIDDALEAYRKVITIYPFSHDASLYQEIALIELSNGRLDDARRDFLQALRLNPRDWRVHELLGEVYRRQGAERLADASYRRARELRQEPRTRL